MDDLKYYQKTFEELAMQWRQESDNLVIEGALYLHNLLQYKVLPIEIACTEVFYRQIANRLAPLKHLVKLVKADKADATILVKIKRPANASLTELSGGILVINGMRFPGNIGDVIRTAVALGVSSLVCCQDTASPFKKECLDMSFGHVFGLTIHQSDNISQTLKELKLQGYNLVSSANSENAVSLSNFRWPKNCALVIGSESRGISQEVLELSDEVVKIEMRRDVDALTCASASAILMHEMIRSEHGS